MILRFIGHIGCKVWYVLFFTMEIELWLWYN